MKKTVLAIAAAAMLSFGVSAPALPQGWNDDAPPPRPYGQERSYERQDRGRDWGRERPRRDVMGPREVTRMRIQVLSDSGSI